MTGFRNLIDKYISIYLIARFLTGTDYRELPETISPFDNIVTYAEFRIELTLFNKERPINLSAMRNRKFLTPKLS